ncbi:hypothetical protein D3C71_1052600 [compost metagenome]
MTCFDSSARFRTYSRLWLAEEAQEPNPRTDAETLPKSTCTSFCPSKVKRYAPTAPRPPCVQGRPESFIRIRNWSVRPLKKLRAPNAISLKMASFISFRVFPVCFSRVSSLISSNPSSSSLEATSLESSSGRGGFLGSAEARGDRSMSTSNAER